MEDRVSQINLVPGAEVERIIDEWPAAQKNVAKQMLAKYGMPNEATPYETLLVSEWPVEAHGTSEVVVHIWPTIHSDFLTQLIDYRVPPEMFSVVAEFDGSILLDRTKGEVSARCDSEATNVLGINM